MKVNYVKMNEVASIFSKEGSLVEVPYVNPSFWEVLMSWHMKNDMKYVRCYMQYVMCYVQYVMCYMQYFMCYVQYVMCYMQYVMFCVRYDMYGDACYSHSMTNLIRFWQV